MPLCSLPLTTRQNQTLVPLIFLNSLAILDKNPFRLGFEFPKYLAALNGQIHQFYVQIGLRISEN